MAIYIPPQKMQSGFGIFEDGGKFLEINDRYK